MYIDIYTYIYISIYTYIHTHVVSHKFISPVAHIPVNHDRALLRTVFSNVLQFKPVFEVVVCWSVLHRCYIVLQGIASYRLWQCTPAHTCKCSCIFFECV